MAKLLRNSGATSQIFQLFIQDSSSTVGAGLTGLTSATAGLTAYYHRNTDTTATVISLTTMTIGTFTSSGFAEIDATNMPGWYQFCPPNASCASGATEVGFHLKGATNMAPLPLEIDLGAQIDGNAAADAMLDRDMSVGTDSGSTTVRTIRQALRTLRNKVSVGSGAMTVCKEDDSTSSWTAAVTTTPGADPVTAIDPAGP